jgi:hypothetical protein
VRFPQATRRLTPQHQRPQSEQDQDPDDAYPGFPPRGTSLPLPAHRVQAPRPASRALRVAARWPTATLDPGRSTLGLAPVRRCPESERRRAIPRAQSVATSAVLAAFGTSQAVMGPSDGAQQWPTPTSTDVRNTSSIGDPSKRASWPVRQKMINRPGRGSRKAAGRASRTKETTTSTTAAHYTVSLDIRYHTMTALRA